MEAPKRLPVSAVLLAMIAGLVGGAIGFGLGLALGGALAAASHVSSMEGGAGYFAVGIALIVTVLSAPGAILLALYWRGVRKIWLLIGLIAALFGIFGVGAAGFGAWYAAQPHILNTNGPTPMLEFEIKPPQGHSLDSLAEVEPELDTDRNVMPGYWNKDAQTSGARAGYVEVYYRTSQRLFVLKFPNHEDRIFRLRLPANPMKQKYKEWSDWRKPDFVAKGAAQPSRASGGNDYQIRYRMDYQDR
jgi:hypothetical protein